MAFQFYKIFQHRPFQLAVFFRMRGAYSDCGLQLRRPPGCVIRTHIPMQTRWEPFQKQLPHAARGHLLAEAFLAEHLLHLLTGLLQLSRKRALMDRGEIHGGHRCVRHHHGRSLLAHGATVGSVERRNCVCYEPVIVPGVPIEVDQQPVQLAVGPFERHYAALERHERWHYGLHRWKHFHLQNVGMMNHAPDQVLDLPPGFAGG